MVGCGSRDATPFVLASLAIVLVLRVLFIKQELFIYSLEAEELQ